MTTRTRQKTYRPPGAVLEQRRQMAAQLIALDEGSTDGT